MSKLENEFNNCKLINTINEANNDDLKVIDLNKPDITKIVLLKKEGAPFKEKEKIAKYFIKNNDKKPIYVESPIYGWILKYIPDDKKIILEPCKHETFYVKCCLKCGFKKTEEYDMINNDRFVANEFSYSKEKAESMEKKAIDTYLNKQKLILLLDLDNTIIHTYTSKLRLPDSQIKNLRDLYKTYFAKVPIKNEINRNDIILVKFRPFLKTFLKNIQNKYEIYIYTHGTKEYATGIIQYINLNFERDSLSTRRMLYRVVDKYGNPKIKSIKDVFPTQENMLLIIDDRINVWKESGGNFICIYPYKFFNENDELINELSNNKLKNINIEYYLKSEYDNVLFCITNLLLAVHRKFFEFYSKFHIQKSIKRIINDLLYSIFQGKKFYYHLNYYSCPNIVKKSKKEKTEKHSNEQSKDKDNKDNDNKNESHIKNNDDNIDETQIKNNDGNKNEIHINNDKKNINETHINNDNKNINENNNNNDNNKNNEIKVNKEENVQSKNDGIKRNKIEEKNKIDDLKYKIEKLGGELIEDEKEKLNADIFLTDFYDEKDPIIISIEENNTNNNNKKIPILHCHYIEICLMYFYEVGIDEFILSPKLKILKFLDLNQIFTKNKVNIINFYGNKDFIDEN